MSIVVTKESFANMPMISSCLPDFKLMASEKSKVLNDGQMQVLSYHLPGTCRLSQWQLLFTTRRDGYSHFTFFEKLSNMPETILVVKDTKGYVFGAFLTEEWHRSSNFYDREFYCTVFLWTPILRWSMLCCECDVTAHFWANEYEGSR